VISVRRQEQPVQPSSFSSSFDMRHGLMWLAPEWQRRRRAAARRTAIRTTDLMSAHVAPRPEAIAD
jgi:hypothetical protein